MEEIHLPMKAHCIAASVSTRPAALLSHFNVLFSFATLLFCSEITSGDCFVSILLGRSRATLLLSLLPGIRRPFFSPLILAL